MLTPTPDISYVGLLTQWCTSEEPSQLSTLDNCCLNVCTTALLLVRAAKEVSVVDRLGCLLLFEGTAVGAPCLL